LLDYRHCLTLTYGAKIAQAPDSSRTKGLAFRGIYRLGAGVIDRDYAICFGLGWVCENHPTRAWDEKLGCQCGAGMPCACQNANGLEQPDVSKVLETDDMEIHRKNQCDADNDDAEEKPAHHFSRRTPLNFLALFLTAMN
jgi:hypothetical protein